jgi:hypothetical protein
MYRDFKVENRIFLNKRKMVRKINYKNMKPAYTFIKGIMTVAAMLLVFSGEAKLKGLPLMKSYKDYNLKKSNVESLKYTIYTPVVDGEKVTKGELADFTAEIFFDDKGYRVKEIVYNIETGKVDVTINCQYNEAAGTVIETRTDGNGELLARTEYLVNYKLNTVLARRYQNIEDRSTKIVYPNVLVHEELWTENAKQKSVTFKKTYFDIRDGIAAKQSISEELMEKPYTLYLILENLTAPIDYTWLYNYNDKALKASSSKSKKEAIYDGSMYEYKAKSKLLSSVLYYGSDKILKNETNFVYSFDSQKNWTEVVQKENNKPVFIVQRDIKYRK